GDVYKRQSSGAAESATAPEEELGNLAPTAAMAASLQAAEALKLLTGRPPAPGMFIFDLADGDVQRIRL
ncbi:MAG: HesA/MoeB/ThiF family protein, partial [Desulfovibrio sp.]|nr:HesA/MoeB/ThiF family protein [Desulfovibrio sp.]